MAKKEKEVVCTVTAENLSSKIQEYVTLSEQIKLLDDRKKQCGNELKIYAEMNGSVDDKGSSYVVKDDYTVGKVARTTVKLNREKALELLKKKNLLDAIITVEEVDEDKLEAYMTKKKITTKELSDISDVKTSYAVSVVKNEEQPEVEKTEVKHDEKKKKLKIKAKKR